MNISEFYKVNHEINRTVLVIVNLMLSQLSSITNYLLIFYKMGSAESFPKSSS